MPKIAFVFESFVRAGSQRHIVEIIKAIKSFQPATECSLFIIAPINRQWGSFLPELGQCSITITHLPYAYARRTGEDLRTRAYNWWSRHHRERQLNEALYEQLNKFDSIVCAQPFVADLLLPNLNANQRFCFHLSEHIAQRSGFEHSRLLQNKRLQIIFQHRSQIAQLPSQLRREDALTWPLRLNPDQLRQAEISSQTPSEHLRITHYSRISPMRFIDRIIDAFSLLHKQARVCLRIAGFIEDEEYHQKLCRHILQLGLSDYVRFDQPVPSPAEDPSRSEVDLVWMISLSSHIGYAAIEAMAAGMATLLLEVDSQAHTCAPDPALSGLICATPEELVERSLALQADPSTFLEEQAQLVRDRFITSRESIAELTAFYLGQG